MNGLSVLDDEDRGNYWPGDPRPMEADDLRPGYVGDPPGWEEDQPLDVDRLLAIEKEGEMEAGERNPPRRTIEEAKAIARRIEETDTIKFKAAVWKVGTLGTGGIRVQLNLDQAFIKEMAMLADCQHELIELEFEARQSRD